MEAGFEATQYYDMTRQPDFPIRRLYLHRGY